MNVRLVAGVLVHRPAQQGRQVLVEDDGLEGGDDPATGGLEHVLVRPVGVHLTHLFGLQY